MITNVEKREDGTFILTIKPGSGSDPFVGVKAGDTFEYEGTTYTIRVAESWFDGSLTYHVTV